MKKRINSRRWLAWALMFCLCLPVILPVLAEAEASDVTLSVDGAESYFTVTPYQTELGVMADARDLARAFGMEYRFDESQKMFVFTDEAHGDVVLMHEATKFYSGENEYPCERYFYVENTVPMIEVGFFCLMFGAAYEYDAEARILRMNGNQPFQGVAKVVCGDTAVPLSLVPFEGEYGLMAEANGLAKAWGLDVTVDREQKTVTFYDLTHGNVVLTDGATSFQSGDAEFTCLPYFYFMESIPVVDVDFFCQMYGAEYVYRAADQVIELFPAEEDSMQLMAVNKAPTQVDISGKVSYPKGNLTEALPVTLYAYTCRRGSYGDAYIRNRAPLGGVTISPGQTTASYHFTQTIDDMEFYGLYYEASTLGINGYLRFDGQSVEYPDKDYIDSDTIQMAQKFPANMRAWANITLRDLNLSGTVEANVPIPEDGADVTLVMRSFGRRRMVYLPIGSAVAGRRELGTVHVTSDAPVQEFNYNIAKYRSRTYPEYVLFFESPDLGKYGLVSAGGSTECFDEPINQVQKEFYEDREQEFYGDVPAQAAVKIHGEETISCAVTVKDGLLPPEGMEVRVLAKPVEKVNNSRYAVCGDPVELGQVHLTRREPSSTFTYPVSAWPYDADTAFIVCYESESKGDLKSSAGYLNLFGTTGYAFTGGGYYPRIFSISERPALGLSISPWGTGYAQKNSWMEAIITSGGVIADLSGDGVINAKDVTLLRGAIVEGTAMTDINGDGRVNVKDVTCLRRVIVSGVLEDIQ